MITRGLRFAAALLAAEFAACAHGQVFDITNVTTPDGVLSTASGTSNGVSWDVSLTYIHLPLTVTDGTWTGFDTPNHVPPIAMTDNIHFAGNDFNLTFGTAISSITFYLSNDTDGPDTAKLDFGITPTYVSGDIDIQGTAFGTSTTVGGVVRLDGLNTTVLSHIAPNGDGLNAAFFVTAVPAPQPLMLLGLAAGLGCRRRSRAG